MGIDLSSRTTRQESRKGKRSRVLFTANVSSSGREAEARIRDLSPLGALIETDEPQRLGDRVSLRRGKIAVEARVAWVGGNRAGIQFDQPVDQPRLLAEGKSRAFSPRIDIQSDHQRRCIHAPLTEEELRLARLWASQMGLSFEE